MTASASDLVLVLSGGSTNHNPNNSLGGDPSATLIHGVLNNLFNDVSERLAETGFTDYRCFYLFNNNASDAFYNVDILLDTLIGSDTNVEIGTEFTQETQRITISGTPTGGHFTVSCTPPGFSLTTVNVAYDANVEIWAANLANALNTIPTFDGIAVTVGVSTNIFFNIMFSDYRNHDLLSVNTSALTGTSVAGSVSKLVPGAPINSIPSELDAATTPPGNVVFDSPDELNIGTLYAEEGLPIWVKRIIPADTSGAAGVGFKLKIKASPVNA